MSEPFLLQPPTKQLCLWFILKQGMWNPPNAEQFKSALIRVIYIQLIKSMTPSPVIYYLSYNHQYIVFILVSIHVPLLYLTWNVLTFCSLESRISPQLLRNLSGPNDSDRATVTFFLGVNSLLFMVRFSSAIISYFLLFHTSHYQSTQGSIKAESVLPWVNP